MVGSAVVGVALTISLEYGIALLIALLYVPMVLRDMVVGLALWIPLPFLLEYEAGHSAEDQPKVPGPEMFRNFLQQLAE